MCLVCFDAQIMIFALHFVLLIYMDQRHSRRTRKRNGRKRKRRRKEEGGGVEEEEEEVRKCVPFTIRR